MTTPANAQIVFMTRIVLIADDVQKGFFQIGLMLRHEIADTASRLEFALINDGHAVANGFDLPSSCDAKNTVLPSFFQALDDFTNFHAAQRVKPLVGSSRISKSGLLMTPARADALLHALE